MDQFTNLYPVSKTLRFELIPDKRTKAILERTDLIAQDEHRAESYKLVKKIIDRYHKAFIESVLSTLKLPIDDLDSLHEIYSKSQKSDADKNSLKKIQDKLRKLIADALTKDSRFKRIDKKELIREDILSIITPEERSLIDEFRDFTTYFTGFHENRRNMYSAEAQSTAIAYRLIHENLPKFIDNMLTFEKIAASPVAEHFTQLYQEMEEYLNVREIGDLFKLDYYTELLTQSQIEVYNAVIGGRTVEDSDKKIQGINEYVNLYNQQQPSRETRLPKLKPLFKQILSDREAVSWLPEEFESDKDMLNAVKDCYHSLNDHVFDPLRELLANLSSYNLDGIYIPNDLSLTDISQAMFKDWSVIKRAIAEDVKASCPLKRKESIDSYEERINKLIKREGSFSIGYLNHCIQQKDICDHFATLGASDNGEEQTVNLFLQIQNAYAEAQSLIENDYPVNRNLAQDKQNVAKLKTLLDAIKALQRFVKPLLGNGDEPDKDERFYGELAVLWEELDSITPLYNKVRNRMTRKPYSIEKFKLNFENSTLLDGWDLNKERDNTSVILRKDEKYYLGIMRKQFNRVFVDAPAASDSDDAFEKMEYKLLPGANKMLPKVFFSRSRIAEFAPSQELLEHYEQGTHKKGDNFSIKDCHELIDFFKASIQKHEDWSKFDFHFSPTETYEDLSGFYREVEQMGYKISYKHIPTSYINQMVEEGKLFLFQIYNKDFSPYSKGAPNLHTLYWKMVFDERNLADVVYKLNGQAEVFYRKKSLSYEKPTHPAHQAIKNKNPENEKKSSTFDYDLIKDRRFTMDKFQFHVPITINFKATGAGSINPLVNQYIHDHDDLHFIGIDRGERHLLYVTVIDAKGHIKEQFSLNEIVNEYQGNTYKTDYHSLLGKRDDERQRERQSWNTIESIKELKQGYLSQAVHKIVTLMVKYHAIVVLEDLNMGFKRGRQKVESSVYQQFEKALIDKLNLLIDKKVDPAQPGGLLHAYQLTNKFTSFRDMRRQNGFLFYIPAWNTSKIDPVTGFVNLLHPRYESVDKSRAFFCKFKSIRYNEDKGWYEFSLDYNDFTTKAEGSRTHWTLCTHGTRVETFRNPEANNMWDSREVNLTEEFNALFASRDINTNGNLKEEIARQDDKAFFEKLMHLMNLTLQMRNSVTGTDEDYLISPVADENGQFYDSRTCGKKLPENADANGAYNIARKGLWVARQIQAAPVDGKTEWVISNKEWLDFVQTRPYLED